MTPPHPPPLPSPHPTPHHARALSQLLSDLLMRNAAIRALDLGYNDLGAEGIQRLTPFLYSNTRLEALVLRGCGVQPPGVKSGIHSLARCEEHEVRRREPARIAGREEGDGPGSTGREAPAGIEPARSDGGGIGGPILVLFGTCSRACREPPPP